MRCLAIMNQKGGVGKTTTAINLAHALAEMDYRVTLIDMDPQSHLGIGLGVSGHDGVDTVLLDGEQADDQMHEINAKIMLLPAGDRLAEVESRLKGGADRGWLLHKAIQSSTICQQSDFCIIDCPPSAGLLGMNALMASEELMIPVSSDFLALHGVSRMVQILDYISSALKKTAKRWFVITRYHDRRRLSREVKEKLQQYFSASVLATPVRESVALAECPSYGKSIFDYQPSGHGAEDYWHLAEDLIEERVM